MSRSFGGTSFTRTSPIMMSPEVASSRPATIRRAVVFPQPDGPTRTMNSLSLMSRLRLSTALTSLPKTFSIDLNATPANQTLLWGLRGDYNSEVNWAIGQLVNWWVGQLGNWLLAVGSEARD